jgi:probable RNA-binding protein EIF1AD
LVVTEVAPAPKNFASESKAMPIKVSSRGPDKYLSQQPPDNINLANRQVAIMPKPRRNLQATAEETMTPPASLTETQSVARVQQAAGNNLYRVELPDTKVLLVELPARFRSTIWIKRGGFVLVDTGAMNERENKLDGEIINIVRNEKEWRKEKYWYVAGSWTYARQPLTHLQAKGVCAENLVCR